MWALTALVLGSAHSAFALDAAQLRGGWVTEINGVRHIYQFKIRGEKLTGVTCGDCYDARTLAFIDGAIGQDGVSFVVTHVDAAGETTGRERLRGTLENGELLLSGTASGEARPVQLKLQRDPRTPNGGPPPGGFKINPPYRQWAPWEQLTAVKVAGVWLSPAGPNKQYFFIKRVGGKLLGMVCGPCDNPYNLFPLDNFVIRGDTLTFDIVHEQNFGPRARPPFLNRTTDHITHNEMQMKVVPSFQQAPADMSKMFAFVLEGPLTISSEATDSQ
jgi:hypothetical protein